MSAPVARLPLVERRWIYPVLWTLTLVGILLAWEWATNNGTLDAFTFSKPTRVWDSLLSMIDQGTLVSDVTATMKTLVVGWVLGVAAGVALGLLLGCSRTLRAYLEPFVVFANALPRLLFLPFLVVWLGFGLAPKVVLVILLVVFMVALTIAAGVDAVSGELLEHARLLGGTRWAIVREVYMPSIGLWVLSSSRTTVGFAFQGAVAAEFIGATEGLGARIMQGEATLNVSMVYAVLGVMFVLALVVDALLGAVQRRVTRWMPR